MDFMASTRIRDFGSAVTRAGFSDQPTFVSRPSIVGIPKDKYSAHFFIPRLESFRIPIYPDGIAGIGRTPGKSTRWSISENLHHIGSISPIILISIKQDSKIMSGFYSRHSNMPQE
jgi:hypothetical protein